MDVIDTLKDTWSGIELNANFAWEWGGSVATQTDIVMGPQGKVLFLQTRTSRIMIYDPATGAFDLIVDPQPANSLFTVHWYLCI